MSLEDSADEANFCLHDMGERGLNDRCFTVIVKKAFADGNA
jgi:hypothetical protein